MALITQFNDAPNLQGDEALREAAIREFYDNFVLADYLHFYPFTGNSDKPRKRSSQFTAGNTRTVNTDYITKERQPLFGDVSLKIYGDAVKTDLANERRGNDIGSQRLQDLEDFCQSLAWYFMDAVINHDTATDSKHITGLKAQAEDLARNTVLGTGNGLALPAGATDADKAAQIVFLERLDKELMKIRGGATCIISNASFISRLESIAKQHLRVDNIQNVYGEAQRVTTYKGVPLVDAGYKNDGDGWVIPEDETVGASSDCTSLYLVRFGERRDVTVGTNVGLDVKDQGVVSTKMQTLVEFDVDLTVLDPRTLTRLSGLRLTN